MRSQPAAAVFAWVAAQPRAALYTTSVNKAEILYGIAALPEGRRRAALAAAAEAMFTDDFADRVLPFDAGGGPLCGDRRGSPPRGPADRGLRRANSSDGASRRRRSCHARCRGFRGLRPHPPQSMGGELTDTAGIAQHSVFAVRRQIAEVRRRASRTRRLELPAEAILDARLADPGKIERRDMEPG
jgi:hypothetical protein